MKKDTKSVNKLVYVKIDYDSYTEITREADPLETYDGDDKVTNHTFNGYKIVSDTSYWDFTLHKLPNINDLYLVYVLHTEGDSFGGESGVICLVALVENMQDAILIKNSIEESEKKGKREVIKIKLSTGKELSIGTSTWMGYFERLESVNIETLNYIKA